ncbi:MAG: multiprotein bridging factor aMBF1 [Candidatus Bathyarchaeia archaeon]|nr:TIGR00270 family protein [Candidatus Bathyarchaeota archaeon]
MDCEICGRAIRGGGFRIVMDGVRLLVCEHCRDHGSPYIGSDMDAKAQRPPGVKPVVGRIRRPGPPEIPRFEVVGDFPKMVRDARLTLGFTQKELAAKINERVSVIQKVEVGKLTPDLRLARKLEKILRVSLITREEDLEAPKTTAGGVERTLGDVVRIKRRSEPFLEGP